MVGGAWDGSHGSAHHLCDSLVVGYLASRSNDVAEPATCDSALLYLHAPEGDDWVQGQISSLLAAGLVWQVQSSHLAAQRIVYAEVPR